MSDKVKLIVEIPKDIYERCKEYKLWSYDAETLEGAVATSKPLSEIKAEIEKIYQEIDTVSHNEYENAVEQGKEIAYENVLSILDNIGNAESEE
mgnify:CR=1 FL=1